MRASNFALRVQPSLLEELRAMSAREGVAVNQLINVAIAEKLAQLRTVEWFVKRAASADRKAGERLLRNLARGGTEAAIKGDVISLAHRKPKRASRGS
jgi:hypothetical protein